MEIIVECAEKVPVNKIVEKDFYDEIIQDDSEIRVLNNYVYIRDEYEQAFNLYIKKIKINDR